MSEIMVLDKKVVENEYVKLWSKEGLEFSHDTFFSKVVGVTRKLLRVQAEEQIKFFVDKELLKKECFVEGTREWSILLEFEKKEW